MEQVNVVSEKIKNGIRSDYFDVEINKSNLELGLECSSLVFDMAFADITRSDKEITKLKQQFDNVLSKCKSSEDFNYLYNFMNEMAKKGGYANEFFNMVGSKINTEGKNNVENSEASKVIPNGITSPYFDVDYRSIIGDNRVLNSACSTLIFQMAFTDIIRSKEEIIKLEKQFYDAISCCKSEEDLKKFSLLTKNISEKGGYALEFYNRVKSTLDNIHIEDVEKYNIHSEDKSNKEQVISNKKRNLEVYKDFVRDLNKIDNMFLEFQNMFQSGKIDKELLEILFVKYKRLKDELATLPKDDIPDNVDSTFFEKCDSHIDEAISYFRKVSELAENISTMKI